MRLSAIGDMKPTVRMLIMLVVCCTVLSCSGENGDSLAGDVSEQVLALEREILGEWVAGEVYFAVPPVEVRQSIKSISFEAENVIEWSYVSERTMQQGRGRYVLLTTPSAERVGRELPTLFVAPERYRDPRISSICLLKITDLEIDFDARFHMESIGKVLKGKDSDGKALVFVRKGRKLGS